jgi:hypothetical protein
MEGEDWVRTIQNRCLAYSYLCLLSFSDCTYLSGSIYISWGLEEGNMIIQVSLVANDAYFNLFIFSAS